jgi:hypothetical protein
MAKGFDPRRNLSGRPAIDREFKDWCAQFAKDEREHIKTRAKENDQFMMFLIEQAHGKATQRIEKANDSDRILTSAEVQAVADEMKRLEAEREGHESILQ